MTQLYFIDVLTPLVGSLFFIKKIKEMFENACNKCVLMVIYRWIGKVLKKVKEMKRAKKRYNVMLRNDLGTWRKMGQFTKTVKAEDFIESCKMSDRKEIVQGYKDLHNEYKIEEITIY